MLLIRRFAVTVACLFAVALGAVWLIRMNSVPFRITIEPRGESSVVTFFKSDHDGGTYRSPEFIIPQTTDGRFETELRSDAVALPGGVIEFWDVTLLPGRFRIRFGETVLDVMERGIDEGVTTHLWQRNP